MQAQVQRVQHEAAARDAEIRLVVLVVVPAERRHAVAALQAELLRGRRRARARATVSRVRVRWKDWSGRRVTISFAPLYVSARRSSVGSVSW